MIVALEILAKDHLLLSIDLEVRKSFWLSKKQAQSEVFLMRPFHFLEETSNIYSHSRFAPAIPSLRLRPSSRFFIDFCEDLIP